jgi:membrane protease YdiL (CAAX protease family)
MDKKELENTQINDSNESQIIIKLAYPDLKSLSRLFWVSIFYMILVGVLEGIFVFGAKNLLSPSLRSLLRLLSYIITLLVIIRYTSKKQPISSFNISFNKIQGWLIPVVVISTLALVVGLERVSLLIPMPESVQKFFEGMIKKNVFSLINIIIAAPILEEILCRGIVLKGLLKNYSPNKAILTSAIFFGAIHLNPWQALPAFFTGIFLGWVFYKTESIIPGMVTHATINATSVLLFFILPQHQQNFLSLLGKPYYIVLCVFSVLIFLSGCLLIQRKISPVSNLSREL